MGFLTEVREAALIAVLLLLGKAPRWVIAAGERLGVINFHWVGDLENWSPDGPLCRVKRKSA